MSTNYLDWARGKIRREESAFLGILVGMPYVALWYGLYAMFLHGFWGSGSIVVFVLLMTIFQRTSAASKSEEERLLLFWLLALAAVVLGVVALLAGVVLDAIVGSGTADVKNPLTLSGAVAITVGAIDTLLFQIYHRIAERDAGRARG